MFVIDGGGNIRRLQRRPRQWESMEFEDFTFIPENEVWDAEQCDRVAVAIGLYDISPDAAHLSGDRWLKRRAREFCKTGSLKLVADPC